MQSLSRTASARKYILQHTLFLTHLCGRLKIKYREFNTAIGKTGAGLRYEDVEENSELANLIGKCILVSCKSCAYLDCMQRKSWKSFRIGKTCMAFGGLYQTSTRIQCHQSQGKTLKQRLQNSSSSQQQAQQHRKTKQMTTTSLDLMTRALW